MLEYDNILTAKLEQGFSFGFDIGFRGIPSSNVEVENSLSTNEHPGVVDEALNKEVSKGRIIGPLDSIPYDTFQLNPLGIVPKKSGDFRLITNLSCPAGNSVNDCIDDIFAEVHYSSVKDALNILSKVGKDAYLSKTDIKSAFRLIPVSPSQYNILCYKWKEKFFIDRCLPMGARSSCSIFEMFSSAIEFILKGLGVEYVIHYLDDFLFISKTQEDCSLALKTFQYIAEQIGLPLAPEKTVLPSRCLEFLGYEISTSDEQIRLPKDKMEKGSALLRLMLTKSYVTLIELQGLCGFLNFACTVIVPGKAFMNGFYGLMAKLKKPYHRVRLSGEIKKDIKTWLVFFESFNGVSLYREQLFLSLDQVHIFSDASQSLGFGAILENEWFYGKWPSDWYNCQNIVLLEFIPVIIAMNIWAFQLKNKVAIFHIDNQALVSVINKMRSKEPLVMNLVRQLILKAMCNNTLIESVHIVGTDNHMADNLSRLQVTLFKKVHPTANAQASCFPALPLKLDCTTKLLC